MTLSLYRAARLVRPTSLVALLATAIALPITSSASVFLDSYVKAQPVIKRAVEAYGGAEKMNGITSLYFRSETTTHQRYQSEKLGPPFDTQEGYTEIAWDQEANSLMVGGGNANFAGGQIVKDEEGVQVDSIRRVWNENANPADPNEHFIHRIVPALLVKKMYQRGQTVTWAGESRFDGKTSDVLAVPWENGNLYMVHVDRTNGLVNRYDILFGDPVAGDAVFESYFEDYKDVGGIAMPYRRWQQIAGQRTFDSKLTKFSFNEDVSQYFETPEGFEKIDAAPPPESELRELASGVYIGNGGYQVLYIEMDDYIVSVDAGGGTGVIQGDLAQLKEKTGDKPLKYSVLTHHHSDHTSGVSALAAAGATIVTTRGNEDYISGLVTDRKFNAANTPDMASAKPKFKFVDDEHVIESGDRRVEIYRVPNSHAADYLVVYLPKEKILYSADVFNLPASGPLAPPTETFSTFYKNFMKLELDVQTVANAHGRVGTADELKARAGMPVAQN
jgi:glyoxylase-like metal-dependent hydrolase (beta-lactamase superfamily II)